MILSNITKRMEDEKMLCIAVLTFSRRLRYLRNEFFWGMLVSIDMAKS